MKQCKVVGLSAGPRVVIAFLCALALSAAVGLLPFGAHTQRSPMLQGAQKSVDSLLTAGWPVEEFGVPGFVDEEGNFHLRFPPEIKKVIFEIGLYNNPFFCDYPATHPDTFVFGWEANKASWSSPSVQRCYEASGRKYAALPFAAAMGGMPLAWNTNGAQDQCASLSEGVSRSRIPADWVEDPTQRAMKRCREMGVDEQWVQTSAAVYMSGCARCRDDHKPKANVRHRVPTLSLEAILVAVPEDIIIEHVRIDAQGVDLQVLKSAGSQMHRIREVVMEVQDLELDNPDFLYGGSMVANADVMKKEMQALNFGKQDFQINNCACAEFNAKFSRG